ncbi:acid-sensing ion channel 2-like [Branchiostoma lanceolatum]|uniref:acid-sensing ion channel 2-like n=1 Tax=Branchiostoma lanceolatum TaxID=7740 RepID=UPI003452376A
MPQIKTESADRGDEDGEESPEYVFATTTSFHGIGRIATAPNLPLRVMWTLATVASYVGFFILMVQMLDSYFKHGTVTDVTLEFVPQVRFPAVTVCNLNKFEDQALTVEEKHYLSYILYGVQEDIDVIAGAPVNKETPNGTEANSTTETPHTEAPHTHGPPGSFSVASITEEKGFTLRNDMHVCTWMGKTCTELDFTHSFSTYGNCYTFNADPVNPINQTIAGSGNGLSVMIDIKSHLYTENPLLPGGTADVGLKLLVHDQNEPPKMDTQGIAVAPGSHAYIAIRQIQYENHVPPWGVCQDLQLEYYDTYTLTGCQLECRSKHVVRNCTCRPIYLPGDAPYCEPEDVAHCVRIVETVYMVCYHHSRGDVRGAPLRLPRALQPGDLPDFELLRKMAKQQSRPDLHRCVWPEPWLHGVRDIAIVFMCVQKRRLRYFVVIAAEVSSGAHPCDCPVPCSMTKYRPTVTHAKWPNKVVENVFPQIFQLGEDYLADNSVVFDVYYDELNFETISQLKAMDDGELASDLGGQMGLFIGASILTLLEIFEYLSLRVIAFVQRRKVRTQKVHTSAYPMPDTLSVNQAAKEKESKAKSFISLRDN